MSKVTTFLGRKPNDIHVKLNGADAVPIEVGAEGGAPSVGDIGARLGKEHEALRTMLNDAALRIGNLDLVKEAYTKMSEPIAKTMLALEQEKLQNATLQSLLSGLSATHEKQRNELQIYKQRTAAFETANANLQEELERTQEQVRTGDAGRIKLANELTAKSDRIGNLEHQLAHESSERQRLSAERDTLGQQLSAAERHIIQFEAEIATAHEKGVLTEAELRSLRKSLDEAIAETARLSRTLTDAESNLAAASTKIAKLGGEVAAAISERDRFANALHDANGKHQAEAHSLTVRLDALQSRAQSAEKLLAEVRQSLAAKTEEARQCDRNNVELTISLNAAHKRIQEFEVQAADFEGVLNDTEISYKAMVERVGGLERNLRERDGTLARAEEHAAMLTDRIARLEADLECSEATGDKRVDEFNVSLQRERMERSMVEGALEAVRRDYAILHREHAAMHANLKSGSIMAV